jgi:hemolysin activation/secretion protein
MDRPADDTWTLPEYKPDLETPGLTLPSAQESPKPSPLSQAIRVFVKEINLVGNEIFSDQELDVIVTPYENREVTTSELHELKEKITKYYIANGYINSGAYIPDQEVSNAVIEIRIVEGVLTEIKIEGNKRLRVDYIKGRIRIASGPPLNINKLQESLLLLQQNPLIKTIHAELKPGTLPGQGMLDAKVVEEKPYYFKFGINNHRPPSVGAERGELEATHQNLLGFGDRIQVHYGLTEGLSDVSLDYNFPINAYDTSLGVYMDKGDSDVTEAPFDILNITSKSETIGLRISHPFYRTPNKDFTMSLSLERRESKTYLLGIPYPFSDGSVNGKSVVSVARFSQEWLERTQQQVLALRSTFSLGLDAFDSSVNHNAEDGKFASWLGQLQLAKRIGVQGKQVIVRVDTQLANDPLLPLEQFSIGGMNTVRGYRENQLVRDNGFIASVEFRMPIFESVFGKNKLQIAPFIDYGRSWNRERETIRPENISSIGLGLRWTPRKEFYGEVYWGKRMRTVTNPDTDLQDDGIHFQVQVTL